MLTDNVVISFLSLSCREIHRVSELTENGMKEEQSIHVERHFRCTEAILYP